MVPRMRILDYLKQQIRRSKRRRSYLVYPKSMADQIVIDPSLFRVVSVTEKDGQVIVELENLIDDY